MAVSSFVESVQFISTTFTASDTTKVVNLTENQTATNCVPFMTLDTNSDYHRDTLTDVTISGSTVTFDRTRANGTVNVKCYVVEFNPSEVRVQQGTLDTTSTATDNVTLSTTLSGLDRAAFTHYYKTAYTGRAFGHCLNRAQLTDSDTLQFYRADTHASSGETGHWYLFEDLGSNFRVKQLSGDFSGSWAHRLLGDYSCVDPLRSFTLTSYASAIAEDRPYRCTITTSLNTGGILFLDKVDGSFRNIYWAAQIVELQDTSKVYAPYGHNRFVFSSSTTTTQDYEFGGVPWTASSGTSTIVCANNFGIGAVNSTSNSYFDHAHVSAELTVSGINLTRGAAASVDTYPSQYMVIDWAGISVSSGTNNSPIPKGSGPGQSFVKSVENFRLDVDYSFTARELTKGQNWRNCALFCSNTGTINYNTAFIQNSPNVFFSETGVVCCGLDQRNPALRSMKVDVSVVEFYPDQVASTQYRTTVDNFATTNFSIDPVSDLNKTFLLDKFCTTDSAKYISRAAPRIRFTSTSGLEFYKPLVASYEEHTLFVVEDLQQNFVTRYDYYDGNTWNGGSYGFNNDDVNWGQHNSFPFITYTVTVVDDYPSRTMLRGWNYSENIPVYLDKQDGSYRPITHGVFAVHFLDNKKHTQVLKGSVTSTSTTTTYSSDFDGSADNITIFNPTHVSSSRVNSNSEHYMHESFLTARVTNSGTREVTIEKTNNNTTQYYAFTLIDWVGYDYAYENGITDAVPTRSMINSVEHLYKTSITDWAEFYLTKGQNIEKCIPFVTANNFTYNTTYNNFYKAVYRDDNPDCFRVRFGNEDQTHNIALTVIEFSDEVSIQYGQGFSTGYTRSFDITPVNLDRTFLHFYAYSNRQDFIVGNQSVCGYFTSSSGITFERHDTDNVMYIGWYVVECSEASNFWHVTHLTDSTSTGGDSKKVDMPAVNSDRCMFLSSHSVHDNSDYPNYGFYRTYDNGDLQFVWQKWATTYNIETTNVEIIEFSDFIGESGLRTASNRIDLSAGTTSGTISFDVPTWDTWSRDLALVTPADQSNAVEVSSTAQEQAPSGFMTYKMLNATTVLYERGRTDANITGYVYTYKFPEPNRYYMEGYVKEQGSPVSRTIRSYRASTGKMTDSTTSDPTTGYFFLETLWSDNHYVVCLDDDAGINYNHLVESKLTPTVISGTFAYNEGWVTTSGFDVGVPLGRL